MTCPVDIDQLRNAIRVTGLQGLHDVIPGKYDRILQDIAVRVSEFQDDYHKRFAIHVDPLAILASNRLKLRAFLHPDTIYASVPIRVMVWRIFLGCDIKKVEFQYEFQQLPFFKVVLARPYANEMEEYEGLGPLDYRVIRNFATGESNGGFVFRGYYPISGK